MNEFHNVGRVDAALRLLAAFSTLAAAAVLVRTNADNIFGAMLIMMPIFVYLFLTALIRDDVFYVMWDVNTTRPRGQMWGGHHGDHGMHFE